MKWTLYNKDGYKIELTKFGMVAGGVQISGLVTSKDGYKAEIENITVKLEKGKAWFGLLNASNDPPSTSDVLGGFFNAIRGAFDVALVGAKK